MGHGTGATSIYFLLTVPRVQGLFQRAVISGAATPNANFTKDYAEVSLLRAVSILIT